MEAVLAGVPCIGDPVNGPGALLTGQLYIQDAHTPVAQAILAPDVHVPHGEVTRGGLPDGLEPALLAAAVALEADATSGIPVMDALEPMEEKRVVGERFDSPDGNRTR